mgnify:CR=1 FL=1
MGSLSLDCYHFGFLMILKEMLTFPSLSNPVLQRGDSDRMDEVTWVCCTASLSADRCRQSCFPCPSPPPVETVSCLAGLGSRPLALAYPSHSVYMLSPSPAFSDVKRRYWQNSHIKTLTSMTFSPSYLGLFVQDICIEGLPSDGETKEGVSNGGRVEDYRADDQVQRNPLDLLLDS